MLIALGASLLFTFTYATLAAKSRRAEVILVPLLDFLQSVPILSFSITIIFFLQLTPGRVAGAEMAAIFLIFTSQAWNMAFSMYQSLKTVPADLKEAADSFRLTAWQRYWRLEVPFAVPGLVWNMMMSMSGGWFFVVASEAISVGNTTARCRRLLHRPGHPAEEPACHRLGDRGDVRGHPDFRPAAVPPLIASADWFRLEQETGRPELPPGADHDAPFASGSARRAFAACWRAGTKKQVAAPARGATRWGRALG
jgi:NitT/TauT family transport system permease protein